jgi:hypothetical protein
MSHLPPCPTCRQAPGRIFHRGFWDIACVNDSCPNLFFARHIYSYYSVREWRYYCNPGFHCGLKIEIESDSFTA